MISRDQLENISQQTINQQAVLSVIHEIETDIKQTYQSSDYQSVSFPRSYLKLTAFERNYVDFKIREAGYIIKDNYDSGQGRSWRSIQIR